MQIKSTLRKAAELGVILTALTSLTLVGCGGGSGGTNAPGTAAIATLSGTAATGMPIVGKVVAIDKNGMVFSATTSALGAYTVNVAGGTAPFILQVVGTSGGNTVTLNSVATAVGQTVNITPLTDLIVSIAAGQPGGTALASLCSPTVLPACTTALTNATTGTNLTNAVSAVTGFVAPLNTANINPLTGSFAANGTGMDAVLDQILVTPASAQNAMATVTLIAVPSQQLGTVTLPVNPGGTATTAVGPPLTTGTLTQVANAATAVSEIQACMASLSALYPANMTNPPTGPQVTPFIDPTFNMGGTNGTTFIGYLSTLPTSGGIATPDLGARIGAVRSLSIMDFTPQTTTAAINLSSSPIIMSAGTITAAWMNMGTNKNWKFVKGTAYSGCPGGWKLAGDQRNVSMHMNARVTKNTSPATLTSPATVNYGRELPVHADTPVALAFGAGSIVINGPGLAVYSGKAAAPVGALTPITLLAPPTVTAPAQPSVVFVMQGQVDFTAGPTYGQAIGFYGYGEAIQSCQDLASIDSASPGAVPPGTPCYDENAVAPGAVYTWTVWSNAATPVVLTAFPYQVNAVPLSMAFVAANDKDIFAQNITAPTVSAMNAIIVPVTPGAAVPDNAITFSYSTSSVYGATPNNCGIRLNSASGQTFFYAEQDRGAGLTGCSFNAGGVGQGSLLTPNPPISAVSGSGYVALSVLGNMTVAAGPLNP